MLKNKLSPYLVGATLSTALSIFGGYILHSNIFLVYSVLGAFSYGFITTYSLKQSLKNIIFHGISLICVFNFGLLIHFIPLLLPFALALLFATCYLVSELFSISNPKYFYILLLFTVGIKGTQAPYLINITNLNLYILSGIIFSIISIIFSSMIYRIPWLGFNSNKDDRFLKLPLIDKIYYRIYNKPQLLVIALHGSFSFFIIGYLVFLIGVNDSVWLIVSCTAVISADDIFLIRKKFKQRILGSLLGIFLGYFILLMHLPLILLLLVLLIMNILFEFYMKQNYLIANIFTNPLVLILTYLISGGALDITLHRLIYLVIGAIIGYFSMLAFYTSLDHIHYYK